MLQSKKESDDSVCPKDTVRRFLNFHSKSFLFIGSLCNLRYNSLLWIPIIGTTGIKIKKYTARSSRLSSKLKFPNVPEAMESST